MLITAKLSSEWQSGRELELRPLLLLAFALVWSLDGGCVAMCGQLAVSRK